MTIDYSISQSFRQMKRLEPMKPRWHCLTWFSIESNTLEMPEHIGIAVLRPGDTVLVSKRTGPRVLVALTLARCESSMYGILQ